MADHILFVHRLVGGLLTLSSEYGFVLEDEEGTCGYALGTVDVKPFIKKCKLNWIPFMQEKYNKPDCQKDLTEAEVGSSSECLSIITLVIIVYYILLVCIINLFSYIFHIV